MAISRRILAFGLACFGDAVALLTPSGSRRADGRLIVPAGIGGSAGQMAQLIQGIVQKHNLMPTSLVVISKPG